VAAIKAPGFGENRKANLQDLAVLTGGQVRANPSLLQISLEGPKVISGSSADAFAAPLRPTFQIFV
jgi:chaperonin GroEL (HSP60 family)